MKPPVLKLRKRISKSNREGSACWSLVDQPSLLIIKRPGGSWQVFCDWAYLLMLDEDVNSGTMPEIPEHVARSISMEKDLAQYEFPTRKSALQAIQMWTMHKTDSACRA